MALQTRFAIHITGTLYVPTLNENLS